MTKTIQEYFSSIRLEVYETSAFVHFRFHSSDPDISKPVRIFDKKFGHYIVSFEVTHYHCLLVVPLEDIKDKKYTKLRTWIKLEFPELKGNGSYSIKVARSKKLLPKYIVKDSENIAYKGFTELEIQVFKSLSYKKGLDNISRELDAVEEQYVKGIINSKVWLAKVLIIKANYSLSIYLNHIKAWFTGKMIKHNNDLAYAIADNIHNHMGFEAHTFGHEIDFAEWTK